jgi:hypothetical protein
MNTTLTTKVAAGLMGLTALGGSVVLGTSVAGAQDQADDPAVATEPQAERPTPIQDLVDDGTLSQEQGDAVRDSLSELRRGRRGHRLANSEFLTEFLGVDAEELQSARQSGQTLAEIAEANGVATDALVDAIVAEREARIQAKIADGTITAEQAEERAAEADLEARVTDRVNGVRPERADRGQRAERGTFGFRNGAIPPVVEAAPVAS